MKKHDYCFSERVAQGQLDSYYTHADPFGIHQEC